jgi:hypothetical protein
MLARRGGARLNDMADVRCSWESEQSKNEAAGMVPLHAMPIGDLKPSDIFGIECGVYGHTTLGIGVCPSPPNITRI